MSNTSTVVGKAIVADDSPTARTQLAAAVKGIGFEVIACDSGTALLSALCDQSVDVIFCDYVMPDFSGAQIATILKNSIKHRDVPLFFVTGSISETIKWDGAFSGADGVIDKSNLDSELSAVFETLNIEGGV